MRLEWVHEELDKACARIQRETAWKVQRLIDSMNDFGEEQWHRETMTWEVSRYSRWEMSRIIYPRLIAELDALF